VRGDVSAEVSYLDEPENEHERQHWSHLLEVYAPLRSDRDGQLIAINEFYLLPAPLEDEIGAARLRAWILVGAFGALLYLLSAGVIKHGSTTIQRQRSRLERQMTELAQLHDRVRQAASRTTAINEQALRRVSADLHDGPGQALALALLRFDALRTQCGDAADLPVVESAVRDALNEVRAISSGLRLPELESRPLADVVERAISDHERHSGVAVERRLDRLPGQVPVAIKIALLRTLQEALSNATRHGQGAGVAVSADVAGGLLCLEVRDRGPGFNAATVDTASHLGLAGMRERTELLGGSFAIESEPGAGATLRACWPLPERVTS
jgi:signal transduction histidine kinase